MIHKVYSIRGMSCAACAMKIQKAMDSIDGVHSARVSLLQNRLDLEISDAEACACVIPCIEDLGYSVNNYENGVEVQNKSDGVFPLVICIVLSCLLMIVSMGPMLGIHIIESALINAIIQAVLTFAVMIIQRHYFINGFRSLVSLAPNMDSLVALGASISFVYSLINTVFIDLNAHMHDIHDSLNLYYESAAMILTLVSVGRFFEKKAKVKTTDAITALYALTPKSCRKVSGSSVRTVGIDNIKEGDIIELKAGECVALDGIICYGTISADLRALTGESLPVSFSSGDNVLSGSHVIYGYAHLKVCSTKNSSTIFKIIDLVDKAASQKPDIARLADKIAYIFVPVVMLISLITFCTWFYLSGDIALSLEFAISALVISCPCALGLATPTAVMVGAGVAAKHGILFKGGNIIERLSLIDTFIFDKTGTLTEGTFSLVCVKSAVSGLEPFYNQIVKSLESKSSHPIAVSVCNAIDAEPAEVIDYAYREGCGLEGKIYGAAYGFYNYDYVKSLNLFMDKDIENEIKAYMQKGYLILLLCDSAKVLAYYVFGDELREDASYMISCLKKLGMKTHMLTGDGAQSAKYVAESLDIENYRYKLMPSDKALYIQNIQNAGNKVCFAGDGINDAPALTSAFASMGLKGASDIALASCDVILINQSLSSVIKALEISRHIVFNIKTNLFWAFFYNIIAIPVACGVFYSALNLSLNPMLAALLMSMSSICVVLNALRLSFINLSKFKAPISKEEIYIMHKEISIDGMSCSHCTSSVHKALSALPGVTNLEVSLERKCATFDLNAPLDDSMLKAVIESLGFKVGSVQ